MAGLMMMDMVDKGMAGLIEKLDTWAKTWGRWGNLENIGGGGSVLGEGTAIAETLSGNTPECLKNSNRDGVAGVEWARGDMLRVGMKEAIGTPQASGSISLPPGPLCEPPNLNYICTPQFHDFLSQYICLLWHCIHLLGCHNKVPQTRRPKGQKFIISQLCKRRDEVRAQTLKEWHCLRTKHKLIKTKWVQDDRQVDFH